MTKLCMVYLIQLKPSRIISNTLKYIQRILIIFTEHFQINGYFLQNKCNKRLLKPLKVTMKLKAFSEQVIKYEKNRSSVFILNLLQCWKKSQSFDAQFMVKGFLYFFRYLTTHYDFALKNL